MRDTHRYTHAVLLQCTLVGASSGQPREEAPAMPRQCPCAVERERVCVCACVWREREEERRERRQRTERGNCKAEASLATTLTTLSGFSFSGGHPSFLS